MKPATAASSRGPSLLALPVALALILGAATALGSGCGKEKKAGCTKDTDCKGERVCRSGACQDPTAGTEGAARKGSGTMGAGAPHATASSKGGAGSAGPARPGPGPSIPGGSGKLGAPGGPGSPGGPPGSGAWKKDSIRICLGGRCVGLGRGFGSNVQDMRAMMEMIKQLVFSGLGGTSSGKLPKMSVCVGPQCLTLDKTLLQNPMALIRLFSNLNPKMLRNLWQGLLGRKGGGATGRGHTRPAPGPTPGTRPSAAEPIRTFAALLAAGDSARGRVALLPKLTITSVSDTRLVLEGPGQEMIVLRVPPALKSLLPKLRITTSQVTVRFRVLSRPIGKLVHGELMGYD